MPYPFDLVRLATSGRLAQDMAIDSREAAAVILEGYRLGLKKPRPALLDEHQTLMRSYVACSEKILADLRARKADWLRGAAKAAADAVEQDFAEWRAAR